MHIIPLHSGNIFWKVTFIFAIVFIFHDLIQNHDDTVRIYREVTSGVISSTEQQEHHGGTWNSNKLPTTKSWSGSEQLKRRLTDSKIEHQLLWGLRILYVVAMYDFGQYKHTEKIIDSARDMCEAGARVNLVLQVAVGIPDIMMDAFMKRTYCSNPVGNFTLAVDWYDRSVALDLSTKHKRYMYDRLEQFDLFVYSEDDMHLRPLTVASFLEETAKLDAAFPEMYSVEDKTSTRYFSSVIRWEETFAVEDHPGRKDPSFNPRAVAGSTKLLWENFLEDYGLLEPAPGQLGRYLVMELPHTAAWLLTRRQMAWLRDSCGFDGLGGVKRRQRFNSFTKSRLRGGGSEPFTIRVWVSSLQFTSCRVRRLVPLGPGGGEGLLARFGAHHLPDQNWKRKIQGKAADKLIGHQQFFAMLEDLAKKPKKCWEPRSFC